VGSEEEALGAEKRREGKTYLPWSVYRKEQKKGKIKAPKFRDDDIDEVCVCVCVRVCVCAYVERERAFYVYGGGFGWAGRWAGGWVWVTARFRDIVPYDTSEHPVEP
jgi:hypothetical protein